MAVVTLSVRWITFLIYYAFRRSAQRICASWVSEQRYQPTVWMTRESVSATAWEPTSLVRTILRRV